MNAAAALEKLRELDRQNGERRDLLESKIRDCRLKSEALQAGMADMSAAERDQDRDEYDRMGREIGFLVEQIEQYHHEISALAQTYREEERRLFSSETAEARPLLTEFPFPQRGIDLEFQSADRPLRVIWGSDDEQSYQLVSSIFNRFSNEGRLSPQVAALLTQAWASITAGSYVYSAIDSK